MTATNAIGPSNTPPLANYGILTGQMFLYSRGLAAFESPPPSVLSSLSGGEKKTSGKAFPSKKCILIGGLSDGMLPVPYTGILEEACHQNGWSLVQPLISSSYLGFGHGTLERDCREIEQLLEYLFTYRSGEEFALVGHSTGCQDSVYFLEHAKPEWKAKVRLVALQAPVSDREGAEFEDGFAQKLQDAQKLVESGHGQEMLPRAHHWAPMTAQRFVDLHVRGGRDDYFSSDYTDAELGERLSHCSLPEQHPDLRVLVAYSGADEYVPAHINKAKQTERLVKAMNGEFSDSTSDTRRKVAEALYLETGNHNLSEEGNGTENSKTLVEKISKIFGTTSRT
mmetsp:Transcript_23577/g.52268  ORF Transcript_23577/g.52268 Transcript_23577/m.52268 type:complete len:339 (-) Transcript_23577:159-1175(-)|eukprot:CAMPEP_0201118424 /NCGR_PEP_ID=MMETSP0850-20130426/2603_1 /ASSEMBLY_ACC=CAM_ASM_000622 /TAXON_ID=183588 /ORGANISM="Pseudo-nitzschia fraudulenta, Strain WWA7" /LENGTH=338 /DNA_ID=CAMNT_0047383629 /DNA_START=215 /DNA_END=1231 /DNA_ORIENTATION=-